MPEERYYETLLDLAKRNIEDDNTLDDYNNYEISSKSVVNDSTYDYLKYQDGETIYYHIPKEPIHYIKRDLNERQLDNLIEIKAVSKQKTDESIEATIELHDMMHHFMTSTTDSPYFIFNFTKIDSYFEFLDAVINHEKKGNT